MLVVLTLFIALALYLFYLEQKPPIYKKGDAVIYQGLICHVVMVQAESVIIARYTTPIHDTPRLTEKAVHISEIKPVKI
jgi:membrane-bound metal-dependent hydrolase YbcI (DUF457 family)